MTKVTDENVNVNTNVEKKEEFPTEFIDLPSKGLLYPKNNPLSKGIIEIRYMTAMNEDILASKNLIKRGIVIDELLKSVIVTPINYNELLIGDKNAIMIATRVFGYGKEYVTAIKCPRCEEKNEFKIDLTSFKHKEFDETKLNEGSNEFSYTLPKSNRIVTFKLLTHGDQSLIDNETKNLKRISSARKIGIDNLVTTRLIHSILSIDGETDKGKIRSFVEKEMLSLDSKPLREYMLSISPDIDLTINFDCNECGYEQEGLQIPLDVDFFWPGA